MSQSKGLSRRQFVKCSTVAGLAAVPAFSINVKGANEKLNLACVGVGGRGGAHVDACKTENIVALCDVDFAYAADNAQKAGDQAKRFDDFRVMLDKMGNEIDAVTIATPDHSHFPVAMACMQAGKHVLIEKPLTQTVWEARTLRAAAHKYKVYTQMGNQGHATEHIRLGKEWFEAGFLGEVTEVHAWNDNPSERWFGNPKTVPPAAEEAPTSMNWDLWLAARAERPFSTQYAPRCWRGWFDFGNGPLGDWGSHTLDLPFWALQLGGPTSVKAEVGDVRGEGYIPSWSKVTWQFPARGELPPLTFTWSDGGKKPAMPVGVNKLDKAGMYMVGSEATLMTGGRPNIGLKLTEADKFKALKEAQPEKTHERVKGDHWQEWFEAIKSSGPQPGANFDYAAPLAQMLILGALAQRLPGEEMLWDENAGRFSNSSAGNALLKYEARKGWDYDLT